MKQMFKQAMDATQLEIRYRYKASRERVFRAWTEPDLLKKWFRAAPEFTTPIAEVDLRVGGRYRLGMQSPESEQPYVATGVYRQIERPEKLVFTWAWEGDEAPETLVTVELIAAGDQTELVLRHENFAGPEHRDQHLQGWVGCLDMLRVALDSTEKEREGGD